MLIFRISLKNRSRHKLDHLIQRRLSNSHFSHYHWSGHIRSYSENFKFPYSHMDSPQNLGLDTSSTKQIGEGHPTLFWSLITILDVAHSPGQIVARFTISSENRSWYKFNCPKRRGSNFVPLAFCKYFAFSWLLRKGTYLRPPDLKSHEKMLFNDIHIILFEQHTKSGNM
jgi:hypothetical protein